MTKCCQNCASFQQTPSVAGAVRGECRIAPPQPTDTIVASARWPLVWGSDWCNCHTFAQAGAAPLRVAAEESREMDTPRKSPGGAA